MRHDQDATFVLTDFGEIPLPRCMKSTQFCFIEGIVQWWPMGKYILKHK